MVTVHLLAGSVLAGGTIYFAAALPLVRAGDIDAHRSARRPACSTTSERKVRDPARRANRLLTGAAVAAGLVDAALLAV